MNRKRTTYYKTFSEEQTEHVIFSMSDSSRVCPLTHFTSQTFCVFCFCFVNSPLSWSQQWESSDPRVRHHAIYLFFVYLGCFLLISPLTWEWNVALLMLQQIGFHLLLSGHKTVSKSVSGSQVDRCRGVSLVLSCSEKGSQVITSSMPVSFSPLSSCWC